MSKVITSNNVVEMFSRSPYNKLNSTLFVKEGDCFYYTFGVDEISDKMTVWGEKAKAVFLDKLNFKTHCLYAIIVLLMFVLVVIDFYNGSMGEALYLTPMLIPFAVAVLVIHHKQLYEIKEAAWSYELTLSSLVISDFILYSVYNDLNKCANEFNDLVQKHNANVETYNGLKNKHVELREDMRDLLDILYVEDRILYNRFISSRANLNPEVYDMTEIKSNLKN